MLKLQAIYSPPDDTPLLGKTREQVKKRIRAGFVVYGDRQIGKTQALLELLHEDYAGKAVLMVANRNEGHIYEQRYREMFPGERLVTVVASDENQLAGQKRIYVDGLSRFVWEMRTACYEYPVQVVGVD
jgi:AAA+ ATPase superfamily predicted ATPase